MCQYTSFSNTMKRKIARVSELDEENGTYTLSAYLIAQLGKNFTNGNNEKISGEQLLQAAVETIKGLQYSAGGMVYFLEAENKPDLLEFYERKNVFKRFAAKEVKAGTEAEHTLIQYLNVL